MVPYACMQIDRRLFVPGCPCTQAARGTWAPRDGNSCRCHSRTQLQPGGCSCLHCRCLAGAMGVLRASWQSLRPRCAVAIMSSCSCPAGEQQASESGCEAQLHQSQSGVLLGQQQGQQQWEPQQLPSRETRCGSSSQQGGQQPACMQTWARVFHGCPCRGQHQPDGVWAVLATFHLLRQM